MKHAFLWILGVLMAWVLWTSAVTSFALAYINRMDDIGFAEVEIGFTKESINATCNGDIKSPVLLTIGLQVTDKPQKQLEVELKLPPEWLGTDSKNLTIRPEDEKTEVILTCIKRPPPGATASFTLSLGKLRGPARLGKRSQMAVKLTNLAVFSAELAIVNAPVPGRILKEPPNAIASESLAILEFHVVPPRSATIFITPSGQVTAGTDFRLEVEGRGIGLRNGGYEIAIPTSGKAIVGVRALHNPYDFSSHLRSLQLAVVTTDEQLTIQKNANAVNFALENSDKITLKLAQTEFKLSESTSRAEAVISLELVSPVSLESPLAILEPTSAGSSSSLKKNEDYILRAPSGWEIVGNSPLKIVVQAVDDDTPAEGMERLVLDFPDGPGYRIEGKRKVVIDILDNDRRLIINADKKLREGNEAVLHLAFDPADPADHPLTLVHGRVEGELDPRLVFLDKTNRPLLPTKDAAGTTSLTFPSPGEYHIKLPDNDELENASKLDLKWIGPPAGEYVVPQASLSLDLEDDDSDGTVLAVVPVTAYLRDRLERPEFVDRLFSNLSLEDTHRLVGQGLLLVGKSEGREPRYLLWKRSTSIQKLKEFCKKYAFVNRVGGDDEDDCFIDAFTEAHRVVQHVRKLVVQHSPPANAQQPADPHVFVIWANDLAPQTLDERPCRFAALPDQPIAPRRRASFIWIDVDAETYNDWLVGPEKIPGFQRQIPQEDFALSRMDPQRDSSLGDEMIRMLRLSAKATD